MVGKREKSGEQEVFLKGAEGRQQGAGDGNVALISDPEPLITHKMPKLSAPPRIPYQDIGSDIRDFRIFLSSFAEFSG